MTKKKINAPIGDDTFISIQKSITDSDVSMEVKLRLLHSLQQADSEIDRMHLLRGELPLEVQDLEDDILGLETRISNLETDVKEAEKAVSQKKIEMEGSRSLIKTYESQKENVKNNREYDSLTKEIEFHGLEVELAEKKIKEFASLVVVKKASLTDAKSLFEGRKLDLVAKKKELDSIVEETSKEEAILKKKSEELNDKIDIRMLNAYHKVRLNARNRLAVVTVKRDACGGCFNKIPPQRQLDIALSKKIIVCEYCGRIIVSPDFEE